MGNSIIKDKSCEFAVNIVKFYRQFSVKNREYVLSRQLLRSGTSVGANVREALNAQSKADFIHKLSISQKECDEAIYWLELLHATEYISKNEFDNLANSATEILRILRSIIITSKKSL